MIRSLIWKEWREQAWRMAFGCVMLVGIAAIGLRSRMAPDDMIMLVVMLVGGLFMPLIVVIGTIGTDREEGTIAHLLALPVRTRTVFAVKTGLGLASVLVPIAAAMTVSLILAAGREVSAIMIMWLHMVTAWMGISLFLWTVAFGGRQPTEARVAAAGLAVLASWYVYFGLVDIVSSSMLQLGGYGDPSSSSRAVMSLNPLSVFWTLWRDNVGGWTVRKSAASTWVTQVLLATALWLWAASRFSSSERGPS